MTNPWLDQIHQTLPRLLALYDTDPISPTKGQGDRYRWAWKLIDFGNGTFQGAAHGLARLLRDGLLPDWLSESSVLAYIDLMFHGTRQLVRSDGSLEEAFPFERSFCVTALVAYDLISALSLLDRKLLPEDKARYLKVVTPLIDFLNENDETHAFISNHLATASAALFKWEILTGNSCPKAKALLDRIIGSQSPEGWYVEYAGADPGYMTLCLYYLADIYQMKKDQKLAVSLDKAVSFLSYACHPDGSFGGVYGSRNTRFYYPSGIAYLSEENENARNMDSFMAESVKQMNCVGLTSMDEPNLIPMFNSYVWAASLEEKNKGFLKSPGSVPSLKKQPYVKHLRLAGLLFVNRPNYYLIVNTRMGGAGTVYYKTGKRTKTDIQGALVTDKKGVYYTSQFTSNHNTVQIENDSVSVESDFVQVHHDLPSVFQFIVLRLLCTTIMRRPLISRWIKKALVHMLITGKKKIPLKNKRTIVWGKEVAVNDIVTGQGMNTHRFKKVKVCHPYRAFHMASSGYWQKSDHMQEKSII